jgi:hypothetical protein
VQNVQRGMIPRSYGWSYAIEAEPDVPEAGAVTVKMMFDADKAQPGTGGAVTLWAGEWPRS